MSYLARSNALFIPFDQLSKKSSPNDFLVCKSGACDDHSDLESPVFHVSLAALKTKWDLLISQKSQVKLLQANETQNERVYVQYSSFWRFPDIIQIQFIPLSDNQSTFNIYSTSVLGYYDFGVNERRIRHWLDQLKSD